MTTNNFNNIAMITRSSMNVLRNSLVLVPRVNRTYEPEFNKGEGKIGDTINVRIPYGGTVTSGKVAVPQGFVDEYKPITLTQQNASLRFSSKELALNVEDGGEFERSVLGPQMGALVNKIEYDGFALLETLNSFTGLPGTPPTDLQYFLDANATMAEYACPQDDQLYGFVSPRTSSSMVYGQRALINDPSVISKQYTKGVLGAAGGIGFLMSQNVQSHTTGTWTGSPQMNGTTAEAASTLAINAWGGATDTLKKGDIIQIAGVYNVNPVSKQSTGQLKQFRVTADTAAIANAMAALPIDPPIYTATSGVLQNCTALPLTTAAVTIFGAVSTYATKTSPINAVIHRDCLGFAAVDLPLLDPTRQHRVRDRDLGMSVRVSKFWDGVTDELLVRLDVCYGWAVLRNRFGCRVGG